MTTNRFALIFSLIVALAAPAAHANGATKKTKSKKAAAAARKPAPKAAPAMKKAPAAKTPAAKKKAPAKPSMAPVVEAPPAAAETYFGAALRESGSSLAVVGVLPGSRAETLKLQPGDELAALDRSVVRSRQEADAAFRGWTPGTRLSAVVRRDLQTLSLQGSTPDPAQFFARGASDLSAQEASLKELRIAQASAAAETQLSQAPPLSVAVPARQTFWIRFPQGLKDNAAPGDILKGEVTTAVATEANLDFLSVTPRSAVWAKVVDAQETGDAKLVRLAFYKVSLQGGHVYPILGLATAVSGEQKLARVSSGGTLIVAHPVITDPKYKKKGPADLLSAGMRLRVELSEPLMITEPPSFYQAGPGLWMKSKETAEGRVFEVSHVIAGRQAEKAGLKVGDVVTSVNGKSSTKLEFEDALANLYGVPGSTVKLTLAGGPKPRTIELKRGVAQGAEKEETLPLPYQKNNR